MNKETIKQTKNTIKISGVTYGSAVYLNNAKKTFNKDKFIVVGGTSYYIPI
ncbi:hypothetical protein UFOVP54_100 [uncultured Caudovirales phage]|uniref:Uncharacterized protein n=1 Tax=uncultured Caudovirales phage TaxID=2100421 RepID=A0A6J5KWL1_9CAUD|nr:hypothetical protein UFOVP54_100 [uncultured Caudovirales phage]